MPASIKEPYFYCKQPSLTNPVILILYPTAIKQHNMMAQLSQISVTEDNVFHYKSYHHDKKLYWSIGYFHHKQNNLLSWAFVL